MQRFRVQCVDRQTGQEHAVLVDALDAESAKAWAIDEGWLVGRVEPEAAQAIPSASVTRTSAATTASPQSHQDPAQAFTVTVSSKPSTTAPNPQYGQSDEQMKAIAEALTKIASSPLVTRPRRTLIVSMLLAASIIISLNLMVNLILWFISYSTVKPQLASTQSAIEMLSGKTGSSGTIDADAVQKALEGIQGYQNELKKATENPLGN